MRRLSLSTTLKAGLALAAFALLAPASNAQVVLYWSDSELQPNIFPQVFTNLGITPTVATDSADFATQVGAGGWDLVVLLVQGNSQVDAQNALINWVNGGGRAITADWTQNGALATAFDASYTGAINLTTVTGNADPIWAGVPTPLSIVNPGWSTFSLGLAPGVGGTAAGTFENGNAAIVRGNGGNTFINGFLDDTYDGSTQAARIALETNQVQTLLGSSTPSAAPEPGTLALAGAVALPLAGIAIRRRKKQ